MNTEAEVQAIKISHEENHLSLAHAVMSGKEILVKSNDKIYELIIIQFAREDGSGNKFLFKAFMKRCISSSGQKYQPSLEDVKYYTGYLNLKGGW